MLLYTCTKLLHAASLTYSIIYSVYWDFPSHYSYYHHVAVYYYYVVPYYYMYYLADYTMYTLTYMYSRVATAPTCLTPTSIIDIILGSLPF